MPGQKIKKYRITLKLSQQQLATKSGLSQSEISYIELNQKSPTFEHLCAIARALHVCPGMLIPYVKKDCDNCCKFKNIKK